MEEKMKQDMYEQFASYQEEVHKKNRKKINIGLRVSIWLPFVFLLISFMTSGSKLVYLILWIVSLFGVAFYLIYVEFQDYKLMEKMKEFGVVDEEEEHKALLGDTMVKAETIVYEHMDMVDEKIDAEKQRIESELQLQKEKLADKVTKFKEGKSANEEHKEEEE